MGASAPPTHAMRRRLRTGGGVTGTVKGTGGDCVEGTLGGPGSRPSGDSVLRRASSWIASSKPAWQAAQVGRWRRNAWARSASSSPSAKLTRSEQGSLMASSHPARGDWHCPCPRPRHPPHPEELTGLGTAATSRRHDTRVVPRSAPSDHQNDERGDLFAEIAPNRSAANRGGATRS